MIPLRQVVIQCASKNLLAYHKIVSQSAHPNYNYNQKFYYVGLQWMDWYVDDNQLDVRLFTNHAPPRAGKSECLTIYTLCYLMQRYANRQGILITSSSMTLNDFLTKIQHILNNDVNKTIFNISYQVKKSPHIVISFSNGSKLTLVTSRTQISIGMGYHYVFLDDCMGYDDMTSDIKNFRIRTQVENATRRSTFGPPTKVFLNNQILGENDISCYLIESYRRNDIKFITLRFMDVYDEDISYMLPNRKYITFHKGEYLVSHFNAENLKIQYAQLGNNEQRIKNEYKSQPTAQGTQIFNTEYIEKYEYTEENIDNIIKHSTHIALCVDFGYSSAVNSDFTAFIMFARHINGKVYALDIGRVRAEHKHAVEKVIAFYNKWKARTKKDITVYLEQDKANVYSRTQMELGGIEKFVILKRSLSKRDRAYRVLSRYEAKCLNLPDRMQITNDLIREMSYFTGNEISRAHDDLVDCVVDGIENLVSLRDIIL